MKRLARTVKNLIDAGDYRRRVLRLRRRRELLGPSAGFYRKANIALPSAARKLFKPGTGILWPLWRLLCFGFLLSTLHAQTTPWFSVTNGFTRCAASTVSGGLPKITFYCINANENIGGSYTAAGAAATGTFTFGLNNPDHGTGLICMVAVNATAAPIVVGSIGTVPPKGAAYSCGSSQSGNFTFP